MATKEPQILALAFPNLNILDLTGPAEVLCNSSLPGSQTQRLTIASETAQTRSCEGVTLSRDLSFTDLLKNENRHYPDLERFDVLVIPGAPRPYIEAVLSKTPDFLHVIEAFSKLPGKGPYGKDRWLFSVCIGAAFLGTVNILQGKTCTTHWGYIPRLREVCDGAAGGEGKGGANVVEKRFVDAGRIGGDEDGVRILTAGGVSCGIDASLWLAREIWGEEDVKKVARVMDYSWEFVGQGSVTEGWEV